MGNRRALFIICLLGSAVMLGARDSAAPTVIPIQNPSFEDAALTHQGQCGLETYSSTAAPGWSFTTSSGVLRPSNPQGCWMMTPVDGANVAFAGYGGSFSQDTGVKPQDLQAASDGGTYTLRFWAASYFGLYPGYYEADISFVGSNTLELCSTDGWAKWHFAEVTLVCPSPQYLVYNSNISVNGSPPVDPNYHIVISFSATGWSVLFDNISLTFTPTPN